MKTKIFTLLILTIGLSFVSKAQQNKGNRTLAWQIDMAQNYDYDSAYTYAENACIESVHWAISWNAIEDSLGVWVPPSQFDLNFANTFFPAKGIKAELQLTPMNTATKDVPKDLEFVSFDDPVMINRFKILLDTVFSRIPNLELEALSIGNEIDIFMGITGSPDSLKYVAYKTFLDSVIPYAKQLYFNLHGTQLKVGTTFTYDGLTAPISSSLAHSLNNGLDIVALTYYPLNNDFTMKSPTVVSSDFASLITEYPDTTQPIYFAECGYSSSPVCNSSEAQQSQFYQNLFSAWDTYQNNIKYITLYKTTDWSQADVDLLATWVGLPNDTIFKEYLRTLGVRTYPGNGTDKQAYGTILCELNARNWCNVTCPVIGIEDKSKLNELIVYPNPAKDNINILVKNNNFTGVTAV